MDLLLNLVNDAFQTENDNYRVWKNDGKFQGEKIYCLMKRNEVRYQGFEFVKSFDVPNQAALYILGE